MKKRWILAGCAILVASGCSGDIRDKDDVNVAPCGECTSDPEDAASGDTGVGADVGPADMSVGDTGATSNDMNGAVSGLYTACVLDPNSSDAAVRACGAADEPDRSCVIENQSQCETGACSRYQGSEPFCTTRCDDELECGDGVCIEVVFQSGTKYCIPENAL